MTDPTNAGDDDLRRLLRDAVADVQPRDALDDIRSRTDKVVPMAGQKKRWFLPTLAVAAVMAVVVGGAFWLLDTDEQLAPSGTPTQGTTTQPTEPDRPSESPTGDLKERAVPVYYIGDTAHGEKLFREFHRKTTCANAECLSSAAVGEVLTSGPEDSDYSNPWPESNGEYGVAFKDGTLTIDLGDDVHDRPAGMSEADAELAIQQLIYSAQAGLGKGRVPVQLLIDGKHTDTVLGVPASEPLTADNPDDVLAPVQIDSPSDGSHVSGTFTVSGRAAAFEANVQWELKQGDQVVKDGFATAQECCTLSPYSFEVTAPPGTYTLVVHDEDMSDEGRPVNEDTKEIVVQ